MSQFRNCVVFFALIASIPLRAEIGTLSTLHSFSGPDGATPAAGLLRGQNGALFGTTSGGGNGWGTVFRLIYNAQSQVWEQTTLYSFSGTDGANPSARLLWSSGSLFGTTANGGAKGFGTVFELTPSAQGTIWTETTLYNFLGGTDGRGPFGNLIADTLGNLYGTTTYGGTTACTAGQGCGTVFELSPSVSGGAWTETVLYRFQSGTDGINPLAGVVLGSDGSLYGTTPVGGSTGNGTAFQLIPPAAAGNSWSETVIFNFAARPDGIQPAGGLALGTSGTLYGTTSGGGNNGCGTVFALQPPSGAGAPWVKNTLHQFTCLDGAYPQGTLLLKPGVVYGTTAGGGQNGGGTVFSLIATGNARFPWLNIKLYDFQTSANGTTPAGNLAIGPAGVLFGTTMGGGSSNRGTVFALIP